MAKRRLFAGEKLKALRAAHGLRQSEMAERLGISVSYLSQIEHDDRPLTPALLDILARHFPLDWNVDEDDGSTRRFAALREAAADPLFSQPLSADQLIRIAEQQPALADRVVNRWATVSSDGVLPTTASTCDPLASAMPRNRPGFTAKSALVVAP